MTKDLHILITNDDGIFAPGIFHLYNAVKSKVRKISIVAPASEKSGAGLSTTLKKPLHIHDIKWHHDDKTSAWSLNGTPADCVKMAISVILDEKPDLIISGINRGPNSGRNVLFSGTVGGIIEGSLRGIPGIAFSCVDFREPKYSEVEKYIHPIMEHFVKHPFPEESVINVNFPKAKIGIKGMKFSRQGKGYSIENPDQRTAPSGLKYYWLGGKWQGYEEHEDSDITHLNNGFISVVPIDVSDLTHNKHFDDHREVFESNLSKHF
jgi:5'-nucleotidase